jgi:hypothetical protein
VIAVFVHIACEHHLLSNCNYLFNTFSESAFADDAMLEDGFDGNNHDHSQHPEQGDLDEMDDYSESDHSESGEDDDEMEIRLGHVDFSDDGAEDDDVIDSDSDPDEDSDDSDIDDEEESDELNESHSDEDEGSEESGPSEEDEHDIEEDENEEDMLDLAEQDVPEEDGWADQQNDELFEGEDVDPNDLNMENPDLRNEIGDEVMGMGDGWTDVGVGGLARDGPGGFAQMLMEALQRGGQVGVGGRGNQLQAMETMLSTLLRDGRVQELEDMGMQVVGRHAVDGGRTAIGIRFPAGTSRPLNADEGRVENLSTSNSIVNVHQRNAPDAGYGLPVMSNRSLAETFPMEYIFGGPAAGAGSEHYVTQTNRALDLQSPTVSENTADLFPGGLAASSHSRQSIPQHPLLSGVDLPPMNALLTSFHTTRTTTSGPRSVSASASIGGIARLRGATNPLDPLSARPVATNRLSFGWVDDNMLPAEHATEDFGSLFGQALIDTSQAIQDEVTARNEPDSNQDPSASQANDAQTNDANEDNTGTNPIGNGILPAVDSDEPQVSTADSGENVDVSSLTISQQESDSNPTLQPGPPSVGNENIEDEAVAESNDTNMTDTPADEGAPDDTQEIQASEQNVTSNDNNQDNQDSPATEESVEDTADDAENPEEEIETVQDQEISLTCPPDIDVEVFNSLPLEMQQEICRDHAAATNGIAAQIGETSGLDPEALA